MRKRSDFPNLPSGQRATQQRCNEFNDDERAFVERIRPLAKQLAALHKQAKSLGIFVGDRELLACPHCGLHEDVTFDGRLIAYETGRKPEDSGLRFTPVRPGKFRCPSCRRLVNEPIVEEIDAEPGGAPRPRHRRSKGVKHDG